MTAEDCANNCTLSGSVLGHARYEIGSNKLLSCPRNCMPYKPTYYLKNHSWGSLRDQLLVLANYQMLDVPAKYPII